jgi:hypothetical protein
MDLQNKLFYVEANPILSHKFILTYGIVLAA